VRLQKMTEMIDISGVDKVVLLAILHSGQKPAGFFTEGTCGANAEWALPRFDRAAAAKAVTRYIDYFCGKAIKMDLSKDQVDPRLYDRDAGQGAFARAVKEAKGHSNSPGSSVPYGTVGTLLPFEEIFTDELYIRKMIESTWPDQQGAQAPL
jgi:hypothetical protein